MKAPKPDMKKHDLIDERESGGALCHDGSMLHEHTFDRNPASDLHPALKHLAPPKSSNVDTDE